MCEPQKPYAKKLETEEDLLCDFIDVKYPGLLNPHIINQIEWLPGSREQGMTAWRIWVSSWDGENALELDRGISCKTVWVAYVVGVELCTLKWLLIWFSPYSVSKKSNG